MCVSKMIVVKTKYLKYLQKAILKCEMLDKIFIVSNSIQIYQVFTCPQIVLFYLCIRTPVGFAMLTKIKVFRRIFET